MVKKMLFALLLMMTFSAIVMSASQLATTATGTTACGDPCDKTTTICAKPCYCFVFQEGSTTGICQPEGPSQLR